MERIGVTGLVKIEMPDATVIRLSDGAEIKWGAETFRPRHATYGAIASVDSLSEGIGNEVPQLQLILHPPSTAAAADLVQPGSQKARVRCWVAQYNADSNAVIDAGDALFDGFLDQAKLTRGPGKFELAISVVSGQELLFELNIGNSQNPAFHKSIWPAETGQDHATGLVLQDAWGIEAPAGQSYAVGGISGIGGMGDNPTWLLRVAK